MGGEVVTLMTTQPERDGAVLAAAERQAKAIRERHGWSVAGGVEVRVYPDVETFRNATGEPGWVAAWTAGRRIHVQPAGVLRARGVLEGTIRHEMLHVFVEAQAAPGLPVWFREGLVGYLEGAGKAGGGEWRESDLRQREDVARARRAYAAAARKVADLAGRYGEAAVTGWLRSGLPAEVK
jgi:stage II sporulation protein D